jgi:hypothetical protein
VDAVDSPTSDAIAPEGAVRLELHAIRALLERRQWLTDQLAAVQRDIDARLAHVRELEGR